ncbi:protein translocase subunit SecF, partial [Methylophilaceae bacterium]|nr:protein translocase subunit SecF [Methylophilaceae bacterium]
MAFFFLFQKGLNYGVDFTGGTIIEISYEQKANVDEIREQLTQINLNEIQVQNFGTDKDVLIRMPLNKDITIAELSELVNQELAKLNNKFEIKRVESVGGQVGEELFENGALAIL